MDGGGTLYEVGEGVWSPADEPIPGEAPFRLGGHLLADTGEVAAYALDNTGQLWGYNWGTWEAEGGLIGGTPPYDLDVLHYGSTGVTLFLAVDGNGVLYRRFGDAWEVHAEMEDADDAPYAVTGF